MHEIGGIHCETQHNKVLVNGEIRRCPDEPPGKGGGRRRTSFPTSTLKAVKKMRPARTEIIICTGLHSRGGGNIGLARRRAYSPTAASAAERRPPGRPADPATADGRSPSRFHARQGDHATFKQDDLKARRTNERARWRPAPRPGQRPGQRFSVRDPERQSTAHSLVCRQEACRFATADASISACCSRPVTAVQLRSGHVGRVGIRSTPEKNATAAPNASSGSTSATNWSGRTITRQPFARSSWRRS